MAKKPKKGMIDEDEDEPASARNVEVVALGRPAVRVPIQGTETISDVLSKAGVRSTNVMADGRRANLNDNVGNTKVLNAVPSVKGGFIIRLFSPIIKILTEEDVPEIPEEIIPAEQYQGKVYVLEDAYMKMHYYTKYQKKEVGGLLKVEYNGKDWIILDAALLPQRASSAYFELDQEKLNKFVQMIPTDEVHLWKGWWHSHVNMDVFWSQTDLDCFNNLNGVMGDVIGIVMNKKRESRTSIIQDSVFYDGEFEIINPESEEFYQAMLKINVKNTWF